MLVPTRTRPYIVESRQCKMIFVCIIEKHYILLDKYFYIIRISWASKSLWLHNYWNRVIEIKYLVWIVEGGQMSRFIIQIRNSNCDDVSTTYIGPFTRMYEVMVVPSHI